MKKNLKELAGLVKGEIKEEDEDIEISGIAKIEDVKEGEITFAISEKFLNMAKQSPASAVIVPLRIKEFPRPIIRVENPRLALAQILRVFSPGRRNFFGIHPSVIFGKEVKIGEKVSIGPYVVIGDKVEIKDNVCISAGVYLGNGVKIREESFLHPGVVILDNTVIGKRVIIHAGAVIGADGFGFAKKRDGSYYKIPQVGKVVIGDNVEIGANVTIDRATMGETRIGKGTKIDNLVHIAHNVTIGKDVAIVALVGISGSSVVGDRVILAGQSGITEHVKIGDNVIIAAKSGVTKDIPSNTFVSGFPARSHVRQKKIKAIINRLPQILERIQKLEKIIKGINNGITKNH